MRRYRCADCGHVWRQDTSAAAEPRAKLSRTGLRWALEGIVVAHLTVARVAEGLGVAWDTANNGVLAVCKRVLVNGREITLAPELQIEGQPPEDALQALLAKVEAPRK